MNCPSVSNAPRPIGESDSCAVSPDSYWLLEFQVPTTNLHISQACDHFPLPVLTFAVFSPFLPLLLSSLQIPIITALLLHTHTHPRRPSSIILSTLSPAASPFLTYLCFSLDALQLPQPAPRPVNLVVIDLARIYTPRHQHSSCPLRSLHCSTCRVARLNPPCLSSPLCPTTETIFPYSQAPWRSLLGSQSILCQPTSFSTTSEWTPNHPIRPMRSLHPSRLRCLLIAPRPTLTNWPL